MNSNNNTKSFRPSSQHQKNPPSFASPPARQEHRDSSYYRNDGRHDSANSNSNSNNHNRDRDRDTDQQFRRDPKDYRQNGFDGGNIRYDDRDRNRDRDRNTNRGQGYDERPPINDRRSMGDGRNMNSNANANRNERRYDSNNYHESSRESSYNTNASANANRRPSNYDDDRRRPMRQNGGDNPGNDYRDSSSMDHNRNFERMGNNFGREHERERERHNDRLDYQRQQQQQRPNGDTNDFRDSFHHSNDSQRYPSRYSTGREDQNHNGGIENGSFRRNEYNDRGSGQQQQSQRPRQPEQRWPASSNASRGDKYNNYNSDNENNDRAGYPSHRTGMGDTRERNREGNERRRPSEWDVGMRRYPEEARGPSMDVWGGDRRPDGVVDAPGRGENRRCENNGSDARWNRGERETTSGQALVPGDDRFPTGRPNREEPRNKEHDRPGFTDNVIPQAVASTPSTKDKRSDTVVSSARRHPVSETRGRDPIGSSSFPDNGDDATNCRKRHREEVAVKTDRKDNPLATSHVQKSSAAIETNPRQGGGESKKIKLSTGASPPPSSSFHSYKTKTNNISTNQVIELKLQDSKSATKIGVTKIAFSSSSLPRTAPAPTKTNTKSFPVKSSSSSLTKKNQIQAKPKPKPINKLGIPMRWLKPKAKPKPVAKVVAPKVPEDASKLAKIPLKQSSAKKSAFRPSSPSNRLVVTDSSEGSSIVSYKNSKANVAPSSSSSAHAKKQKGTSVPAAIVTKKPKKASKNKTMHKSASIVDDPEEQEEEWDSEAESEESDGDASDSESDTDDDEVLNWASKMLGVPASLSSTHPIDSNDSLEPNNSQNHNVDKTSKTKSPKLKIRLSAALKLKLTESIKPSNNSNGLSAEDGNKLEAALKKMDRRKKKREKLKALSEKINEQPEFDHEKAKMEIEEVRRKREEAKPLTAKEIRKILRNDTFSGEGNQNSWVRRSRRQPNMDLLNSKAVRILVDKLKHNDTDMRVLKMKKYINDPNAPCAVMDAMLNAMEENTNCEALYIQVRTIRATVIFDRFIQVFSP